jgi:hypothetical protein
MTHESTPFIDYWDAVDTAMLKLFGIDTCDAGIDEALIASAQDECQTPEEFVRWFGEKYDLTYIADWKISNSPIDIANALTPDWMQRIKEFDGIEIEPCRVVGHDSLGNDIVEPCDDAPEEAFFWTVYGHLRTGGVNAFEDFATEAEAVAFHNRLISAYPHLAAEGRSMSRLRLIELDGKTYLWRDVLQLRREQKKAFARDRQPALFELKDDRRPEAERTASDRYREPSLFSGFS